MISNISNIELKTIKKSLPNFKEIIEENKSFLEKGIYKKLFISVFDHWLTEDESDKLIFIDDNIAEIILRRDKFEKVAEELYKTTDIFLWKYTRNYRIYLTKPRTDHDILRKCDFKNLWSQSGRRYSLLLPEFSAIYNEEWDWTNIIWYIDEEKIKPILEIANKVGLNILK
jgi:hypothetical protein